jgi:integrase/recombinase XerD
MELNQAIADFFTGYFSIHDRSNKTKTAYLSDLEQFARYAGARSNLKALTSTVIEGWAGVLRRDGYTPASIRRKIVVLKVFCGYWLRKGELCESPFWRIHLSYGRMVQLPKALTQNEMGTLLAQVGLEHRSLAIHRKGSVKARARSSSSPWRDYRALRNLALVDLLFATGMRVGEVSTLNVQDFTLTESVLNIRGKGGRYRLAYLVDEQTVKIQRQHFHARSQIAVSSPALFLNSAGDRLSTQGIANIIARVRQHAGIERHVTPHMLRHTVATLLLRNGMDIRVVQEFLGHASIATTQRYTHVVKEHLIDELRKHHPSLAFRSTRKAS